METEPITTPTERSWRRRVLLGETQAAGVNLSWGAVLAGVVTLLAVLVVLSLIGLAIGLGVPDLTSDQPLEGLGTGLLIWSTLGLVVALLAGGFVTGVFAGRTGFLHGVIVWAVGVLAVVVLATSALSTALGAMGNVLGAAGSVVGQSAQGLASVSADAVEGATDVVGDQFADVDFDAEVEQVLIGTGVPELQPDYLQGQVDAARDDVVAAGRDLLTDPQDYEAILDDLSASLQDRVEVVADAVDRDAVAESVAANTDLSDEEAEELTDNVVEALESASADLDEQLEGAEQTLQQVRADIEQALEDGRQVAEDATNAAARGALWTVFGLLVGLVISGAGGFLGARVAPRGVEAQVTTTA